MYLYLIYFSEQHSMHMIYSIVEIGKIFIKIVMLTDTNWQSSYACFIHSTYDDKKCMITLNFLSITHINIYIFITEMLWNRKNT